MATVTVRLFAGAADAAGTEEASLDVAANAVVGDVRAALRERHGAEFADVLSRCSVMIDGRRADDDVPVAAGATLDILPPFAGG
ncbi:MoaD/ThiS family protein [Gulosibacter faecalis]|jgi:molybdopterin converting factor small subunit|uniref:MoaD/ThiS family protein n=1 Tax=Gulosibacter faecalis TaxID=272240 RepID=UPI00036786F2|nr:MoaD/ThiS family protein [Gulosibacter faecalis]